MVQDLAGSDMSALNQGASYANQAGYGGLSMGDYPQYMIGGTPGVDARGQVESNTFDQGIANYYMSPYMQGVINKTKQGAVSDYREGEAARRAQAVQAGAFGGSRRFVEQAIGDRGLADRLSDIEVKGLQSAYENAQQQFERDRTSRQGAQRFNIETGMRGDLANQQAYLTQEQANQRAWQDYQNRILEGYNTSLRSGATLADMQQTGDKLSLDRINALMSSGEKQQDYRQSMLDIAYNDFVNQRDAERQNLQFLSSILRGVPISANSDVRTYEANNPAADIGALGGLAALYGNS
jgi:hypothetical protein